MSDAATIARARTAAGLVRLRLELYGAVQMLKGDDMAEFTQLIREIATVLEILPLMPMEARPCR